MGQINPIDRSLQKAASPSRSGVVESDRNTAYILRWIAPVRPLAVAKCKTGPAPVPCPLSDNVRTKTPQHDPAVLPSNHSSTFISPKLRSPLLLHHPPYSSISTIATPPAPSSRSRRWRCPCPDGPPRRFPWLPPYPRPQSRRPPRRTRHVCRPDGPPRRT